MTSEFILTFTLSSYTISAANSQIIVGIPKYYNLLGKQKKKHTKLF